MLKGFPGNIGQLLETATKMQSEMGRVKEELEKKEVEASAGGGMVKITISGAFVVTKLEIDKTVVDPNDVTMLQDLVRAATNEALRRTKEGLKEEMQKVTGGLPIPGFGM